MGTGLKKRCSHCRKPKDRKLFNKDSSRADGLGYVCEPCRKRWYADRYHPVPADERRKRGPRRMPRRDGDKAQAKSRINHDIELGLRPHPKDLYCALCGHKGKDRRHEYHHHMGYAPEHHYDVLPLCSRCHRWADKNWEQRTRDPMGRFQKGK